MNTNIHLLDSRRLTGPNLFWDKFGAIIDVEITNINVDLLIKSWQRNIQLLFSKLNWEAEKTTYRINKNSVSLVISAPIDALYAATEMNEAALEMTQNELLGNQENTDFEAICNRLKIEIDKESNPKLLSLYKLALIHNVCFLSDDDDVSIGYGKTCKVYPVENIPDVTSIDWDNIECVPVALVTGTNGKSTTVRLASSVIKAAGLSAGITSTDYIRVGERILDTGDYSGPGGARTLLRHPDTEVALLEVARGGLLRRGLGVNQATTVVITNVAEDHLGEYGIEDLNDMVEAKFIVRQAIQENQDLILNADDNGCVKYAKKLKNKIVWFSLDSDNPVMNQHLKEGGKACFVEKSMIVYQDSNSRTDIINVREIPITFSGAAKHNIQNALAVVALSYALGIDEKAIATGLTSFANTPENNPGRGNYFEKAGVKIIVDFAHNAHGLSKMVETINNMPSKRNLIMIGQAGDRTDDLIKDYIQTALSAKLDCLIICEMEGYLRGRKLGDVPALIHKFAIESGMKEGQLIHANSPLEGAKKALEWATKDDVLLLLALTDRPQVLDLLVN